MMHLIKRTKGQTMVEFALGLLVFFVILMIIFEFGRMFQIWLTIQNSAQGAARYAITGQQFVLPSEDPWDVARINAIKAEARRLALTLKIVDGAASTAPGYFDVFVFASDSPGSGSQYPGGPNARVSVDVIYNYELITPIFARITPWVPLRAHSELVNERFRHPGYGTPAGALPPTIQPTPTPSLTVAFAPASQSGPETSGMTVRLVLSASSSNNVTVPYSLSGSATAGADYTVNLPSPVTIPAGVTSVVILTVKDDSLDEDDETIYVDFNGPPTNAGIGTPSSNVTTIEDDEAPSTIRFALTESSVNEGENVYIQVLLSPAAGRNVQVNFSVSGGTATPAQDYTLTLSPIIIPAGSTSGSLILATSTLNDLLDEDDETVIITLGTPGGADLGSPSVHTVTIKDNDDQPTVSFEYDFLETVESTTALVRVKLSAISGKIVTVPYTINTSSTAILGADYTITPLDVVTIPAGALSVDIIITTIKDGLEENSETVILNLGTPTNATLGSIPTHTLTILPLSDPPLVYFDLAASTAAETAGTVQVTVRMKYAWIQNVTIQLVVTGTASLGVDYSIPGTTIVIPPGSLSGQYPITIYGDTLNENNETVIVVMQSVVNGVIGSPNVHTLTINDNDPIPTVSFTSPGQTAFENIGTMLATVTLSAVSGRTVTVPFNLSGSATLGADFTLGATSPLTIPAGQLSVAIPINVIADSNKDEPDETVSLALSAPTNANLGAITTHTAVIKEVDVCPTADPWASPPIGSDNRLVLQFYHLKSGAQPVTITNILINWNDWGWQRLTSIVWGGATIMSAWWEYDSPTRVPGEYPFINGANRSFNPGQTKQMIVNFSRTLTGAATDYSITVIFSNGCSLSRGN